MKYSVTTCAACPVRKGCTVRRILQLTNLNVEQRLITTAPNEEINRELLLPDAGLLTVRKGLVATGTHLGGNKGIFCSDMAGPGGVTGVQYILKGAPSYDYLISLGTAEMCSADRAAVAKACSESIAAMKEMVAVLYSQSGRTARFGWVRDGSCIRQKVERLLSDMATWFVTVTPASLDLDVSHATIASILGVERRHVSKSLSDMQKEGLVVCGRRCISLTPAFFSAPEHLENPWAQGVRLPAITGSNINP